MDWQHPPSRFDTKHSSSCVVSPAQQQASYADESTSPVTEGVQRKRKRSSVREHVDGGADHNGGAGDATPSVSADSPTTSRSRHTPGVRRACNDCRQQKLRCNVVAGPGDHYQACDRCIKHNLACSIDNDFRRLGKRAAHEELVKELAQCKTKLAEYEALGIALPSAIRAVPGYNGGYDTSIHGGVPVVSIPTSVGNGFLGPNEAAASRSLLDLSQGHRAGYQELPPTTLTSITPGTSMTTLGNVTLTDTQLTELYSIYFISYHPYLPLLNPDTTYKEYYGLHPLLHWTIVAVAARRYDAKPGMLMELQCPFEEMLWTTISRVPQAYHVCKAMALLCAWPLPTSSTSHEPTMILMGVMFQLALQYGLHRPSHAQDFSRIRVDLREEDIADRSCTWAAMNLAAQNISTGQGQPALAKWAWFTYGLHLDRLKPALRARCQIEKFVDNVTKTLFTMQRDHVVVVDYVQRGLTIEMYARELGELELTILSTNPSPVEIIFLKAAALHLRMTFFFDKPDSPNYIADLKHVYVAAHTFLEKISALPPELSLYVTRYIEQMMLAAAITLTKILSSPLARHVDIPSSNSLFARSITNLRNLSVRSNDLPQRLAEVIAQFWKYSGAGERRLFKSDDPDAAANLPRVAADDDGLQLKVRCRSSLSVLYDAVWHWRERVGQTGRDNLAIAVEHPTAISSDTHARNTPQPGHVQGVGNVLGGLDAGADLWDQQFGGNAVFDTLSWALDGNLGMGGGELFGPNDPMLGYP